MEWKDFMPAALIPAGMLTFGAIFSERSSLQVLNVRSGDTVIVVKDTVRYTNIRELPLKPTRRIQFNTNEGSWMSVDVSPDGKTIAFDLMGDIYTIPVSGGTATFVTKGLAFETHPRFSPDGNKILFTSDRSGSDNIWYIDRIKEDTIQLTKERADDFPSAVWTPDGEYIVASKGRRAPKLVMYHKDGGGGVPLIDQPIQLKTIDPFVAQNGRYIYYSQRFGSWNYNAQLPQYQIGRYDKENGKTLTITSRYGSAFTPTVSKDNQWMAYGSRYDDKTGLVLRNMNTGDEKWLAYPVQRDEQESVAPMGVLPGMSFTPDSKFLIASYGGKIWKISIVDGKSEEIPFSVNVNLELGPRLEFKYPIKDTAYALATQIRDAIPSADGKKLAFTVLDRLYTMDYPNGTPKRVTNNSFTEAFPVWSPDGTQLAFVSWQNEAGGHIYKTVFGAKGPVTTQLTKDAAMYVEMAWSPNDRIVFSRADMRIYKDAYNPFISGAEIDIAWIPAAGGAIQVIDKANGRGNPHFSKNYADRIFFTSPGGALTSMKWDGTDEKTHVKITGITTYGSVADDDEHTRNGKRPLISRNAMNFINNCMMKETTEREMMTPSSAAVVTMSPSTNKALAQVNNDIYIVTIPQAGKTVNISVADPGSSNFPARKLTDIGGEWPFWEANGQKVHWSIGNGHFVYDLIKAEAFDDSVKVVKKKEERKKAARIDSIADLDSTGKFVVARLDSLMKLRTDSIAKKDTTKKSYTKPQTICHTT